MNNSVSDPTDYAKSSIPKLSQLDSLLRCHICKNFLKNPVLTPCSHTFCSICMRLYLSKEAKCPLCLKEVRESMLRSEYLVNEIVGSYTNIRDELLANLKKQEARQDGQDISIVEVESDSESLQVLDIEEDTKQYISKQLSNQRNRINNSHMTKKVTKKSNDIHSFLKSKSNDIMLKNSQLIECPVCSKMVPKQTLESLHLDKCLEEQSSKQTDSSNNNDDLTVLSENITEFESDNSKDKSKKITKHRAKINDSKLIPNEKTSNHFDRYLQSTAASEHQRLPKINFSHMVTSQIKLKLASLNLPSTGTRQNMIERYNHYEILWNSNFCDSINPVAESELRRQLASWEVSQKKASNSSGNSISSLMEIAKASNHGLSYKTLMLKFRTDSFNKKAWANIFAKEFNELKKEAMSKLKKGKIKSINEVPSETQNEEKKEQRNERNDITQNEIEPNTCFDLLSSENVIELTQQSNSNDSIPDITISNTQEY
ncbi:hypothetical protein TPHA_0D03910 [Tetrapisispora phaffii CBS 4417]|uniref:Postreplication repair E3 ubiquitin-protein ligase RAD18 n=1 Tax=Tetrapisispora phaffii (strain ATCC 24235 / CBS 4417 / NBRC 1672 / NRRL Y-8282 / UCD 70-5) TaxID=1071381 RepID=G8BT53_TETPH|nr:hypothetical protein TPHA_0D03910 [Tetrapisispora phaffii CBS 4417]CCE63024.1 hypothetical protein TPHA_0D03910 [Tetrapisispora phaffii CBS 4417]